MITSPSARQLPLDIEEEVWRHLLFHKSMIDDDKIDLYDRIDRYMEILKGLNEGVHVTIKDSYSRSIAMILELAIDEYLDPWDVDLVRFCRLFIDKVKGSERLNLMVVGKIIRMAYEVHYLKSSNTLRKAETIEEEEEPLDDPFFGWMEDDETFEVTKNILSTKEPPLIESVIRKGDRPVTLLDLLNALEDVEEEVVEKMNMRKARLEARKQVDISNRKNIRNKVYSENIEEEIRLTWQRINQFNGHPIPFDEIHNGFRLDGTTTFISLLFLAKMDRVKIWQRRFPHGEIMVKNKAPGEELRFGDLEENLEKAREGVSRVLSGEELIVEERPIPDNWNT
jgi:segregation and condensation protein A